MLSTKTTIIAVAVLIIIAVSGALYFASAPSQVPPPGDQAGTPPPAQENGGTDSVAPQPAPVSAPKLPARIKTPQTVWDKAVESPSAENPSIGLYIVPTKLSDATAGQAYSGFVTATADPSKNFEWKVIWGKLPPGIVAAHSLDCSKVESKVCRPNLQLSGVPQAAGVYGFRVAVSDGTKAVYKDFGLTVKAASNLKITTVSLPEATLVQAYSAEIAGFGGAGSYSWNVRSGSLPPGLTLVSPSCANEPVCRAPAKIIGTPGGTGTFTFGVVLTSGEESVSKELSITVK